MADKGLAPVQKALPALRSGNLAPILFRVSQSRLSPLCKQGLKSFCCLEGEKWVGGCGGRQLLHKACFTRPGRVLVVPGGGVALASSGFLVIWVGMELGLQITAQNVLLLRKLI